VHIPKVATFTIGAKSIIDAMGWLATITHEVGSTVKVAGDIPKEHIKLAPLQIKIPMMIIN
jgi:hypothetical protein